MRNNWFYAEFHLKLEKLCKRFLKELPGKENATKLEFWQIKGDTFDQYVSDGVWNQFMWEEYGVTIELQKDFLGFVDTIVALPVLMDVSSLISERTSLLNVTVVPVDFAIVFPLVVLLYNGVIVVSIFSS